MIFSSRRTSVTPHRSDLFQVAELRRELEARRLDSKGVKNSLIQRLQEALDEEKANEEKGPAMEVTDELVEVPDAQEVP